MPSPFTWDITNPTDNYIEASFPLLARNDKTTLKNILGSLLPFGTPTVGWRQVQIDNNVYLTSNASWTGSVWNRDDVAVTAWRIDAIAAGNFVINYAAAAANPITWVVLVTVTPTGALITSTLIGVPTIPSASSSIPFR